MPESAERLHRLMIAIAPPIRLRLIEELEKSESDMPAIERATGLPFSALRPHLESLRQAGVVALRRRGVDDLYSLAIPEVGRAVSLLRSASEQSASNP